MLDNKDKTVTEILEERASVYGSYKNGVTVRASIVESLVFKYKETHPMAVDIDTLRVMFNDLALKLMRFAADPQYEDSLKDLQGYAQLINDSLQGRDDADN